MTMLSFPVRAVYENTKDGLFVTVGDLRTRISDPIVKSGFTVHPDTGAEFSIIKLRTRDGSVVIGRIASRDLDRDRKTFDFLADRKFALPTDPKLRRHLLNYLRQSNPSRRYAWEELSGPGALLRKART
jgi:hypothetical protein